jgi:SAM-dependent methyltransferase
MAVAAGGPVLELAAGSGRVAIALARKGHQVTGLELSERMLDRARARTRHLPAAVQQRLRWAQGDMAHFDLPGEQFALIFVAFNSFWLLTDPAQQRGCLGSAARHLAPGGRVVLDLFPPSQDDFEDEDGIAQYLAMPFRGSSVLRIKDYRYNAASGIATSTVRYCTRSRRDPDSVKLEATFTYRLRPAEPAAVVALLEGSGYAVEATYGDYGGEPLTPDAPRAVYVARRAVARGR